jgi:hypothetical protein
VEHVSTQQVEDGRPSQRAGRTTGSRLRAAALLLSAASVEAGKPGGRPDAPHRRCIACRSALQLAQRRQHRAAPTGLTARPALSEGNKRLQQVVVNSHVVAAEAVEASASSSMAVTGRIGFGCLQVPARRRAELGPDLCGLQGWLVGVRSRAAGAQGVVLRAQLCSFAGSLQSVAWKGSQASLALYPSGKSEARVPQAETRTADSFPPPAPAPCARLEACSAVWCRVPHFDA